MKKTLLGLGTVAAVTVPIIAVVACSVPSPDDWNKNPSSKMFGTTDDGKCVIWTFTNTDGLRASNLMYDRNGCIDKIKYGYWHLENDIHPYTKHVNEYETKRRIKWD